MQSDHDINMGLYIDILSYLLRALHPHILLMHEITGNRLGYL